MSGEKTENGFMSKIALTRPAACAFSLLLKRQVLPYNRSPALRPEYSFGIPPRDRAGSGFFPPSRQGGTPGSHSSPAVGCSGRKNKIRQNPLFSGFCRILLPKRSKSETESLDVRNPIFQPPISTYIRTGGRLKRFQCYLALTRSRNVLM